MLDVIHYLFEDDALASPTGEHMQAKDSVRQMMYRDFYKKEYKYASLSTSYNGVRMSDDIRNEELSLEGENAPVPLNPRDPQTGAFKPKGYIQPSRVNYDSPKPFGSAIDAPLG